MTPIMKIQQLLSNQANNINQIAKKIIFQLLMNSIKNTKKFKSKGKSHYEYFQYKKELHGNLNFNFLFIKP